MKKEIDIKHSRLKSYLKLKNLKGILFSKQTNFLWFTGGKLNDVVKNDDNSSVYLFITENKKYLIATNSDADRVMEEELIGLEFELIKYNWFNQNIYSSLKKIGIKSKIGADFCTADFYYAENDISDIRRNLTDFEVGRFKRFSLDYAKIITDYCLNLKKGLTERKLAAGLNYECNKMGIRMPTLMVGSDERVFKYKHPCATDKKIDKYVLIATVAEREGICAAITRCLYFGKVPSDLKERLHKTNKIITQLYANSVIGTTFKELFEIIKKAYKEAGYDEEWTKHLQGAISAYKAAEFFVVGDSEIKINNNNILIFFPTILGTKSEDPILVKNDFSEVTVFDKRWPYEEIEFDGKSFKRPLIMEL